MTSDINTRLQSDNDDVVLSALYDLSGDFRFEQLDEETERRISSFLRSKNEDVVWRAIFFFGIVRPSPGALTEFVDVVRKWSNSAPHIVLAVMDSIARMINSNTVSRDDIYHVIMEIEKLGVVEEQFNRLKNLYSGRISYDEYIGINK